jgi:hypothetical protein
MEIYALFDEDGHPKGFYTPVVHSHFQSAPSDLRSRLMNSSHKGLRRWVGEEL